MSRSSTEKKPSTRGDATRERLIAAALELFGRRGYEGVGAREITAAADVPLSAIPYHFGTKEALYRAVVERVCAQLAQALAPAVAAASDAVQETPEAARKALVAFEGALLKVIAASPQAEAWAKLLLREHLDPGPAYDLVYEDAGRGAIELIAALIARATRRAPDEEEVLIEAFARMGQVLAFRTLQAAALRRLGWTALGPSEVEAIEVVLAAGVNRAT